MKCRLFLAVILALVSTAAFAQSVISPPTARTTPGYVTGRSYLLGNYQGLTTNAAPISTTVIYLYPFTVYDEAFNVTSLNSRAVTGVASCVIKLVVFATSPATKRPTGLPLIGSNTSNDCSGSSTTQTVSVTYTFVPGNVYWAGIAVSVGVTQFISLGTNIFGGYFNVGQLGVTTLNSAATYALTAPYTFATDIMTLNLTGATFTDYQSSGVPVIIFGN